MPKATQTQRVLAHLKDGAWHSAGELELLTGITRIAARIWDLKKRGYMIEAPSTFRDKHGFQMYRLRTTDVIRAAPAEEPKPEGPSQGQLFTFKPLV